MGLPVVTAVTGAVWESDLVAALDRTDHGVTVVRRCVDLPELLSAAAAGTARAALLSSDLRRLDRDAVTRLTASGVAVVGLTGIEDEAAERRLRQLGVDVVLAAGADPAAIAATILRAVDEMNEGPARRALADPRSALPELGAPPGPEPSPVGEGRIVAVWGPTGAPGRTTVAIGIADEAARLGIACLLVDADVYGGVVAQALGLLDESPGLAAACRLAGNGQLDQTSMARLAWTIRPTLRVLTGIVRADRWPELRPGSVEAVLHQARLLAPLTVVDCGFSIERDEEVGYDVMAPRRNGATLAVLLEADDVVCVGGADPVALQRLVRSVGELRDLLEKRLPLIVVNRVRDVVVPGNPRREIAAALARFASVGDAVFLPHDREAVDLSLGLGKTLAEVAPDSPLRREMVHLAARLARVPAPHRRRRHSMIRSGKR